MPNRPGNQPSKRRNPLTRLRCAALCCAANVNRTTHTHTNVAPLKSRRLDRRHGPGGLGNLETRKPAASSASQSGTDGSGQVNGLPHLGVLAHSEAEESCIIGTYLKQARVLLPSPSSLLPFPCLPTHDHTEQDMTVSQSVGPLTHSRTHSLPSHIPLAPRMEQVQFGDTFPVPLLPCPKGLPTSYTPQRSAHGTPKTPPDTDSPLVDRSAGQPSQALTNKHSPTPWCTLPFACPQKAPCTSQRFPPSPVSQLARPAGPDHRPQVPVINTK